LSIVDSHDTKHCGCKLQANSASNFAYAANANGMFRVEL